MVVKGVVTLTNVSSGASYRASSNRSSGYSVQLPPGDYSVTGISLDDFSGGQPMGAFARGSPVVVTAEAIVEVNLYVQIR